MSRSENTAAPKLFALEIEDEEEIEAAVFLSTTTPRSIFYSFLHYPHIFPRCEAANECTLELYHAGGTARISGDRLHDIKLVEVVRIFV